MEYRKWPFFSFSRFLGICQWLRAIYITAMEFTNKIIKFISKISIFYLMCLNRHNLEVLIKMLCNIYKAWCSDKGLLLPDTLITHVTLHEASSLNFSQLDYPNWTLVPKVKVKILAVTKTQKCLYSHENVDCRQAFCLWGVQVLSILVLAPCRSCLLLWLPHQPYFT